MLELVARLKGSFIQDSDTSINLSLDSDGKGFPLGQPFYMDMSHEHVILSLLTAYGAGVGLFSIWGRGREWSFSGFI